MAFPYRNSNYGNRLLIRLGVFALVLVVAWLSKREPQQRANPPAAPRTERQPERERPNSPAPTIRVEKFDRTEKRAEAEEPSAKNSANESSLVIRNLTLRDEDGNVVFRGNIDLQPTLERIAANRKLRFSNDGSVFENRERRLPRQNSGYYHEWVVPTPGERGPGPQRLVVGAQGDVWYTADHYRTFRRIPYQFP
jgi:ribonuclease T1